MPAQSTIAPLGFEVKVRERCPECLGSGRGVERKHEGCITCCATGGLNYRWITLDELGRLVSGHRP